jgi:serine/threonine protein kinase
VTEHQVWLVLEYCQGDELYHYLCNKGALPVETAQKIFTQLVGAVAYIHSKACVHRDLKLENVLLDKHDNVKLVDFGFTREYEGKASYLQTFCGTVCYSAPEMLRGEKYAGEKVDVWSLGIILYALLKGELPFDEDDDAATKAKILKEEPVYPDTFPEAAKTLISKLLSKRPFPRPSLADILVDPFLAEHAPQQQAILKLSQPAPFTTALEKITLERMKSAGVDIDRVIENVLSQRCDSLAGWWALLIEKETRKEVRREKKRKERDAEMKLLRRLSGASGRFSGLITLEQVDEEGKLMEPGRRSTSRGRSQRRSTPQILVSDLPKLPEGAAIDSPGTITPPPPIDKDSIRSRSGSRPPLPPKERRRRSSHLQLVATNPDLLAPVNGIKKSRGGKRRNLQIFNQLSALKHWFVDTTKRGKSPGKTDSTSSQTEMSPNGSAATITRPISSHLHSSSPLANVQQPSHDRAISNTSTIGTRPSSYGNALTPVTSNGLPRVDTSATNRQGNANHNHRNSLSPSPLTPRSGVYRRSSSGTKTAGSGLRGRKSTSSSVSSVRSLPRHPTHSKASSVSSNSIDTIHSPGSSLRGHGRSPHASIKILPATPRDGAFSSSGRMIRASGSTTTSSNNSGPNSATSPLLGGFESQFGGKNSSEHQRFNEAAIGVGAPNGLLFAKRKKSPFKGPMLNSSLFGTSSHAPLGSPAVGTNKAASENRFGLRDLARRARGSDHSTGDGKAHRRKSNIIEEEEEEEEDGAGAVSPGQKIDEYAVDDDDDDIEEVDEFSDIEEGLKRGERVDSIVIWDDPAEVNPSTDNDGRDDERETHSKSGTEARNQPESGSSNDLITHFNVGRVDRKLFALSEKAEDIAGVNSIHYTSSPGPLSGSGSAGIGSGSGDVGLGLRVKGKGRMSS